MRKEVNTDMKISSFKYYISDALKSLKRNLTISTASVATVSATLFILGVFLLVMVNIESGITKVEDKVEIKIFLKEDITIPDQNDLEVAIKGMNEVRDVKFESKSDALKKWRDTLAEKDKGLLSGYSDTDNPLPASYIVTMNKPEYAQIIAEKVKGMPGVESVGNDKELIEIIISISNALKWVGIVIFLMLIGVSLFLIGNTIRLTVFSRRREIGIMKFVGATDWFIRWPFIFEGIFIGIIGAIMANVLLYYFYKFTFRQVTEHLIAIQMISPSYVFSTLMLQFVLAGTFIGAIGSFISLRKFLTV